MPFAEGDESFQLELTGVASGNAQIAPGDAALTRVTLQDDDNGTNASETLTGTLRRHDQWPQWQ